MLTKIVAAAAVALSALEDACRALASIYADTDTRDYRDRWLP